MTNKMTDLEKIHFLVEELFRQTKLYNLSALLIVADPKTQAFVRGFNGRTSEILSALGHLIVEVGKGIKNDVPELGYALTELMRLSIQEIEEETSCNKT